MTVVGEEFTNMFVGVGTSGSADTFQRIYGTNIRSLRICPKSAAAGATPLTWRRSSLEARSVFGEHQKLKHGKHPKTAEDLAKAGIPTVVTTMSENPEKSPVECIKLIGQLFGKEQRAKEIADFIEAQFTIIKSQNLSGKKDKPTVYQEKGSGTAEEKRRHLNNRRLGQHH